jgi:hypothetical protein
VNCGELEVKLTFNIIRNQILKINLDKEAQLVLFLLLMK